MINLKDMSPVELLKLHSQIIDEFKIRGIAKTRNQPISEYSKWLVINQLKLHDTKNPNEKYDGIDNLGKTYLVRSRQIIDNRAINFCVIRRLGDRNFDFLVAITFDKDFNILDAFLIPIDVLLSQTEYNDYQNGYLLNLNNLDFKDQRIKNVISILNGL